jgi:SPP1 family predicted phage head-tail adaptor
VSAGKLDQRVTLQRRTTVADEGGGGAESWVTVADVWADAWPVSGAERTAAQQLEAAALVRVRIRRRADVTASWRVLWLGRAHAIRHVADGGPRDPYLTLDCEAGVAP